MINAVLTMVEKRGGQVGRGLAGLIRATATVEPTVAAADAAEARAPPTPTVSKLYHTAHTNRLAFLYVVYGI